MTDTPPCPIYINAGSVRMTAQECWLCLGVDVPGRGIETAVTLALPLQCASGLYEALGAALTEYASGAFDTKSPEEPAVPFTPEVVRALSDPIDEPPAVYEILQGPSGVLVENRSQIVAWCADGISATEMARRVHVSPATIWRFLHKEGLVAVRHYAIRESALDAHAEMLWDMRRHRKTYNEIAAAYHVSKTTVGVWFKNHPVPPAQKRPAVLVIAATANGKTNQEGLVGSAN